MNESDRMEKKEISEEKRRTSLAVKRAEEKQRQATISSSLRSLGSSSKKIVFESGSEDEAPVTAKRLKLFDEDNDGNDESAVVEGPSGVEEFEIVNRHFGKKGAKLAKMEAKFGHDARFRMDERFMDSDSEEPADEEAVTEKEAHLAILSKVLGKTVTPKTTSTRKAAAFHRFDPENELHLQWLESRKKKEDAKNVQPDETVDDSVKEKKNSEKETVEEHFFEMDENFAKSLKEKMKEEGEEEKESFSFLKSIGREPAADVVSVSERLKVGDKAPVDSIPIEERVENFEDSNIQQENNIISSAIVVPTVFFLSSTDTCVIKVLKHFRRKHPLSDIRRKWGLVRRGIIKLYKKQRRRALKEEKSEQQEENKYSKSNPTTGVSIEPGEGT